MKVVIFGDSFADRSNFFTKNNIDESWTNFLEEKIKHPIENNAISGTSIWWSYKNFLDVNLDEYDAVIFVYAPPSRIHHVPDNLTGCNYLKVFSGNEKVLHIPDHADADFLNAVEVYFKYFQSDVLDNFIYQSIFDSVNKICDSHKIEVINILPFENNSYDGLQLNLDSRTGTCFTRLLEISGNEIKKISSKKLREEFMLNGDPRWCHLTKENNEILSNKIFEELINSTKSVIRLAEDDFVFSKAIINRYL